MEDDMKSNSSMAEKRLSIPYFADMCPNSLILALLLVCILLLSNCDRQKDQEHGPWQFIETPDTTCWSLLYHKGNIFLGTSDGIYHSSDDGLSWTASSSGMSDLFVESLAADCTGNLFASTSEILYKSTNDGESWTPVLSNLHSGFSSIGVSPVNQIFVSNQRADSVLLRSTDGGATWTTLIRLSHGLRRILFENDSVVYVANSQGNGYKSTDRGNSWIRIPIFVSESIVKFNDILFATSRYNGLEQSIDHGSTWSATACPIDSQGYLVKSFSDQLIVNNQDGGKTVRFLKGGWEDFSSGLPNATVWDMIETPEHILFAATYQGLYCRRLD